LPALQQLNEWLRQIEDFLPSLGVRLNPSKTILQPVGAGSSPMANQA
jgi:hypothetical protein